MITIINFSHPIAAGSAAESVRSVTGSHDYKEIMVHCHLDQTEGAYLQLQCTKIVAKAIDEAGQLRNIDCIILPGLSIASVLIVRQFQNLGYMPNILRIAPTGSSPPRFEAVEIIRL